MSRADFLKPCAPSDAHESWCWTHKRDVFECAEILRLMLEQMHDEAYAARAEVNTRLFVVEQIVVKGEQRMRAATPVSADGGGE